MGESAVERYLHEMYEIRSTGGHVEEESFYPALSTLLNEIGGKLKPKVRCVSQLKDTGAGSPDFGLYTANQFRRGADIEPLPGQLPERGVIEVKPLKDRSWVTADGEQGRHCGTVAGNSQESRCEVQQVWGSRKNGKGGWGVVRLRLRFGFLWGLC